MDCVSGYTIFNIGGNNYRLITSIYYNRVKCYIREILTHAQYSQDRNQEKIRRGQL
ncbi:type II toxin-antitoxin system HigB family toxin [Thiotrichales bacterium 19S9-12]|nr:type II toxin-antitoxin system HigB family toxin [Thiotrichales bacterium 19S9-11]MCF6811624.1 type II toxin-antitoxin system HigB family toxin [Thiotrichales bacterium 19S9-12]